MVALGYAKYNYRGTRRTGEIRLYDRVQKGSILEISKLLAADLAHTARFAGNQSAHRAGIDPLEELPESCASMAITGFFFGAQFGECFVDFGKIK